MKNWNIKKNISLRVGLALAAWSLLSTSFAAESLAIDRREFAPQCSSLQRQLRQIQETQFKLQQGGQSAFSLNSERDKATAELAIVEGIIELKSNFEDHRQGLLNAPLENLAGAIKALDEGTLAAGRMAALESFLGELSDNEAEYQEASKKILSENESDPTRAEVLMEVAISKCESAEAPTFCSILESERQRTSGLAALKSLSNWSERRPIEKTLREFAKTYQVLAASNGAKIEASELDEFKRLLTSGESFDATEYHGQMDEMMKQIKRHSQALKTQVSAYEACRSEAAALGESASHCQFTSPTSEDEEAALISNLNEAMNGATLDGRYRISSSELLRQLESVKRTRELASEGQQEALGASEGSAERFNQILAQTLGKVEFIHGALTARGMQGAPEDYFRPKSLSDQSGEQQGLLNEMKTLVRELAPACASTFEALNDMDQLKSQGQAISTCTKSLNENNMNALKARSTALRAQQQVIDRQIEGLHSTPLYRNLEEIKTFVAMRFQKGRCLEELGARGTTIETNCNLANIDIGFPALKRLTDNAGQVIAEYQMNLIGSVETREGEKAYATKLSEICRSPEMIQLNISSCHEVDLYQEIVHRPTAHERRREIIETKNVTYDPVTRKRVIRDRKSVVSDPAVLGAATKNLMGVAGAFMQGNTVYNQAVIDGNMRMGLAWNQYYLNQFYWNQGPFFTGSWSMGGYPFALTSTRQTIDTQAYYNTP